MNGSPLSRCEGGKCPHNSVRLTIHGISPAIVDGAVQITVTPTQLAHLMHEAQQTLRLLCDTTLERN